MLNDVCSVMYVEGGIDVVLKRVGEIKDQQGAPCSVTLVFIHFIQSSA